MYEKISTVVVFDASRIFPGEEHRSRSDQLHVKLVFSAKDMKSE
jgi:predicted RNA-binding protein with PIN domain